MRVITAHILDLFEQRNIQLIHLGVDGTSIIVEEIRAASNEYLCFSETDIYY